MSPNTSLDGGAKHSALSSMQFRMTFQFSLAVALLMMAICGGWTAYGYHSAYSAAEVRLSAALSQLHGEVEREELAEELRDMREQGLAVVVMSRDGKPLAQTPGNVPIRPAHDSDRLDASGNWRIRVAPLASDGSRLVVVGVPWRETAEALRQHTLLLIALCVVVVIIMGVGAWVLVGRTLAPIGKLVDQASSASGQDMALRLVPPSQDAEIVSLVDTLNAFLNELSETTAAKGRFYAAASHELRTPLQGLSGHLELALQRIEPTSRARSGVEEASCQAQRLIALVKDLLFLNQLDSNSPVAELALSGPVSVVSVCQNVLADLTSDFQKRGIQVSTDFATDIEVSAPSNHLFMLIRNLVENAAKYTSQNGQARFSIENGGDGKALRIVNSANSISEDELSRLTEPFYRPDPSRSSATGGNGLGLALCRAICQANGWSMTLHSSLETFEARVSFT
jgi:signal transduction histidine kinase